MGLLVMMVSVLLAIGGAVALAAALLLRQHRVALVILGVAALWALTYGAVLFTTSWVSRDRLLSVGEAKAFCGLYLDCHLHARVVGVHAAAVVGSPGSEVRARGRFLVVRLRIESNAKRVTLGPDFLQAVVVDGRGREFLRDRMAERALLGGDAPPLDQRVAPGQGYERTLVFDVPADARDPRLQVSEGHPIQRFVELFLIGDEDSLFHGAVLFRLDPAPAV